jgi:hypothetical protein
LVSLFRVSYLSTQHNQVVIGFFCADTSDLDDIGSGGAHEDGDHGDWSNDYDVNPDAAVDNADVTDEDYDDDEPFYAQVADDDQNSVSGFGDDESQPSDEDGEPVLAPAPADTNFYDPAGIYLIFYLILIHLFYIVSDSLNFNPPGPNTSLVFRQNC